MKFATWNVNSLTVRVAQVLAWLDEQQPDVLVLQETKLVDEKFPYQAFVDAGYQALSFGQKTYNGVALLARQAYQVCDASQNIVGFADEQARVISATIIGSAPYTPVRVIGGYFPNGQAPESDKFIYKMRWLDALRQWLAQELRTYPNMILMGDFNIAPEDRDVYDPMAWAHQIHCTPEERAQFQALLDLGLVDAFRLFEQAPKSWSWWDYRNLAFRKNQGLRIDHILVSQALQPAVKACWIDKLPRKNERPSDHAPVMLEL